MKPLLLSRLLISMGILLMSQLTVVASETYNWKGKWISSSHTQSRPNTWLAFRKEVRLENTPSTLVARIGADSKYWLWVNGRPVVFEGGLKRGPAPDAIYFDEVDIAPYLTLGDNVIAVLLWHFGKNGFTHLNSGSAGLLFDAVSPEAEIFSDNSWGCAIYDAYGDTDAPHPNFRLPESNIRFDARLQKKGWERPGFRGKFPKAAVVADAGKAPFGRLLARPIPQWRNTGLRQYESIRRSDTNDTIYCRLPYNCQVTPYLKVNAKEGKVIHILTDNYTGGSENNLRAEYVTCDGEQEYENYGWFNGHEVRYVIPEGVDVVELKYRETGYDTDFTGAFECDDEFLNELWRRSARTLYVTMRDNYMDCPDRERAQWWGDEVNELGETFYALSPSAHSLAVKGIYELMNWQRDDGVIYSPIPSGNWRKELPLQMLASVGWYGFHTQYYYSGDSSFVADIYPRMKHYLHDVWQLDGDGLVISRPGDWNWADWGQNSDLDVLTNCWYYLALKGEREFARQLGYKDDVDSISSVIKGIENAFDMRFWNGKAYRSPGHKGATDDRAQAMAVVSGLAAPARYKAIVKILDKEYHASPYMEKYVLEALFMMNEPDRALDRMHKRYAKMLSYDGYTTLFEGWGIGAEGFGGGTVNHAWSGGPLTLLSQKVCGITPVAPGFAEFSVTPQMGRLKKASATVDTNYGLIKVSLEKSGDKINARLHVPEKVTAHYADENGRQCTVGGGTHFVILKINHR